MARLSMAQRRKLPKSAFAVPSKAPGPGSYPEPDAKHAAVAKGYAKRFASAAVQKKVKAKAKKFTKGSGRLGKTMRSMHTGGAFKKASGY